MRVPPVCPEPRHPKKISPMPNPATKHLPAAAKQLGMRWQGMARGAGVCVHHGSSGSTGRGGPRGCEGEWWLEWHTSHDQIEAKGFSWSRAEAKRI